MKKWFLGSLVVGLCAGLAHADWAVYSQYHFDAGAEYVDSGPAGLILSPVGYPGLVPGYSGDAFSFCATESSAYGLFAENVTLDLNVQGFRAELWFKAGNDQVNNFPRFIEYNGIFDLNLYDPTGSGGVRFTIYGKKVGTTTGVTSTINFPGNFLDDQWHFVKAEYDPTTGIMSVNVDHGTAITLATTMQVNVTTQPLIFASNSAFDTGTRGLNGEIDEVTISTYTHPDWAIWDQYHFDEGAEMVDSGPAANDMVGKVGEPASVLGYSGNAFSYDATTTTQEGLYTNFLDLDMNARGIRSEFWFKAGDDQVNNFPRLFEFASYEVNFYSDTTGCAKAGIRFTLYGKSYGSGLSLNFAGNFLDDQWHYVVAEYEPKTSTMTLNVDDGTPIMRCVPRNQVNIGPSMTLILGANNMNPAPGTSARGFNGEIDEVTMYVIPPVTKAPVFSPADSEISGDTPVTISSETSDAMIYYTTDGSIPTTAGTACSNPVTVTVSDGMTLKAIAVASDNSAVTRQTYVVKVIPGDANGDKMVDVGDLGILAANYGLTSGATWAQGDFNGDGAVDVGDLGILAANYGTGTQTGADFNADYAKVFGHSSATDTDTSADDTSSTLCSSFGLPLIFGLFVVGLMLVKMEE